MDKLLLGILLCLALICLSISTAYGELSIRLEPPGPVKPGTHVRVICNVSKNYADSPVTWLRKTASVEFQIARQQSLESSLYASGRYILDSGGTATGVLHILEIKPVEFEDISEIGCSLQQSTKNPAKYVPLIVCSNPDSDWCKCIKKKNWADPKCAHEASNAYATNKRLKEGLGVCLGIAIIYGLVMTILAGIDCSSRLHQKRLHAQKKAAAQAARNRNPYGDSERLTLDVSDAEQQSMNTSQDVRSSEPMRYPELTTQANGGPKTPVKADVHTNSYEPEDREDQFAPPSYAGVAYPQDPYQQAANSLSNAYNDYGNGPNNHYDMRGKYMQPLNTISEGYDRGQLPRNGDYNTPGKLSTHSADYMPQYNTNNADMANYPNSRGAYSEQKPRQHGRQGHQGNAEPRRLDFAHTKAAEAREPSGPYISPDTSV